jgi:predicted Zn finger-like uncharacterized protein
VFASCDHCFAEYELDDSKIPAGGARLRCKNCDHYFVIVPSETSDLQSADDLAHDALAPEVPHGLDPDPERGSELGNDLDLDGESERGSALGNDLDLDGESERGSALGDDLALDGESDRGSALGDDFDLDGESDRGSAPEEGFDLDGESDRGSEPEEGFDPDGEIERETAPEEGFDPDDEIEQGSVPEENFDSDGESDWEFNDQVEISEPGVDQEAPESAFDRGGDWSDLSTAEDVVDDLLEPAGAIDTDAATAVDDLLGEIGTADSQLGEPNSDLTSESEFPSERLDLGDAEASDGSGGDPAADGGGSLEDLSDWDLFDQPAETDASAALAGPKSLTASAARDGARAEPRVEIAVAMADDSLKTVRWTDRISEVVGWGAVLLMMIVALVGGLASNSSDARAPAGSWSGAGFEADQIVGRWVDNAVAGSIYVVSGRIRGAPGSDRASQKSLGIRLFDTKGREIDRAPIPLGPVIPERILRESSPAELDAFQTRHAGRIAAASTRWVSFEAVLTDLPRFAGRFELQAFDR